MAFENDEHLDEFNKAREDALEDIKDEYEHDAGLVECYFGSAYLINTDSEQGYLVNLLLPDAESYEEAVGAAYLDLQDAYPVTEGWVIVQLSVEENTIWADAEQVDELGVEES